MIDLPSKYNNNLNKFLKQCKIAFFRGRFKFSYKNKNLQGKLLDKNCCYTAPVHFYNNLFS